METDVLTVDNKENLIQLGRFILENEKDVDEFLQAHGVQPTTDRIEKTIQLVRLNVIKGLHQRSFGPDFDDLPEDDPDKEINNNANEGAGILGSILGGVASIFGSKPATNALQSFLKGFFKNAAPPDEAFIPGTPEYEARIKEEERLKAQKFKKQQINTLIYGSFILAFLVIVSIIIAKAAKSAKS